jgi:hypothetical protein
VPVLGVGGALARAAVFTARRGLWGGAG